MSCFLLRRLRRISSADASPAVWTHCAHAGLLRKAFLLRGALCPEEWGVGLPETVPRGGAACRGAGSAQAVGAPPCLDFALLRVAWPWASSGPREPLELRSVLNSSDAAWSQGSGCRLRLAPGTAAGPGLGSPTWWPCGVATPQPGCRNPLPPPAGTSGGRSSRGFGDSFFPPQVGAETHVLTFSSD